MDTTAKKPVIDQAIQAKVDAWLEGNFDEDIKNDIIVMFINTFGFRKTS